MWPGAFLGWPGRDNQKKQSEGKKHSKKTLRPSSEGMTCKKRKKRKSQLFISIINADNLTPHHEAQILRCPALNSSSTFLAAELIRAAWSADRLGPRLRQHITPVYSQLWTEIWCFHHNFYYLSYTSLFLILRWAENQRHLLFDLWTKSRCLQNRKQNSGLIFNIILRIF